MRTVAAIPKWTEMVRKDFLGGGGYLVFFFLYLGVQKINWSKKKKFEEKV